MFNILPNSNYYVLDIIDFFRNNNIEEYVKNNDNILGYSFQEIAIFLNEYLFGEDIEHDILSEERNFFSYSFSESLPKNLEEILEKIKNIILYDKWYVKMDINIFVSILIDIGYSKAQALEYYKKIVIEI